MRKRQQKQILELIETLREAQSAGMYADAQECALIIGEFIENLEGEGTKTVELLEEYYETLYKVSIEQDDTVLKKKTVKNAFGLGLNNLWEPINCKVGLVFKF